MRSSSRSATSSTRSVSCRNASCRPAAWLTRSSRPLTPSTVFCAARSRLTRIASTPARSSATSATAPAARAARPPGSVNSSTALRIRARSLAEERRVVLDRVVVLLLLARHRPDLDLDRDRRVQRRRRVEPERRRRRRARGHGGNRLLDLERLRPAFDPQHDDDVGLVVLALVREVDGELGVRAVRDPVGGVRGQRQVAHLDGVDPGAVQARRRLAAVAAATAGRQLLPERVRDDRRVEPLDSGEELRLLELLRPDVGLAQRRLDQRQHARGVDDVGAQEHLHRARDLLDRLVGRLGVRAQRRAHAVGDRLEPVAAHLHRHQERPLRGRHVVGGVDPLGLLVLRLGLDAVAVDARGQIALARVAEQVEERLADLTVGGAHDRCDVAVVVLERALARRVATAVDHEHKQRDDQDERAEQGELPYEHGLTVRNGAGARGRRSPGPDPGAGLVVLVEEGQERNLLTAARSSRSRLSGVEDMRRLGGSGDAPFHAAWRDRSAGVEPSCRVHATEELPAVAQPGLAMGRYRVGARLGAGGFGTVYAARDERLGRPVALKLIPGDGPATERVQREARAVARLDHDAIVALFDAGEEDGCRYLVSELVEGRTLAQLEQSGELSDRDVLRIGLALADALGHAHERGVIHRDVKPQNVIVPDAPSSRRGAAKLTDFGVAHLAGEDALTRTGDVVGTLAYMAPEQAGGNPVDERADLYSLGLVLYEALTGANPVRAGSPTATARRIGTVLPPLAGARGDLPAPLCAALDRAVLPDPEQRGDLDDLFDALAEALPGVPDGGGRIAPHPLERDVPALPPEMGRLVAPAAAAALVWAALAGLTPEPAIQPPIAAVAAGALVAVLPRTGWLLAALATVVALALGQAPRPGAAIIVAALAAGPPPLLRADGRAWSVPALAPALGLLGLAGAFPALAARGP